MPIAPCFDPTTGASGGASAGGGGTPSLANVTPTAIDLTDGTWTLTDPNNLIKSVTFGGGFNIITWNAVEGTSSLNWTAGTTTDAPRWHKVLNIGGTDITAADLLVFTSRIEQGLDVADFNNECVVGVATDPTSSSTSAIDGSGGSANRVGTGNPTYGTWQVNSATASANAANVFGMCTVMRGFAAVGSGIYLNIAADGTTKNSGSRNSNVNAHAYTGNVHVMVGVGVRSNGDDIDQDDQQKFKASFGAITYGGLT